VEVQKLCRNFSEKRYKEADQESEAKVTAAIESARFRIFDRIEDERVTQDKITQERLRKRQVRLAQNKDIELEKFQFADETRSDRAVKRNFTSLKSLLGESPLPETAVKDKLASKIQSKRVETAGSRDADERKKMEDIQYSNNKMKSNLENEKRELIQRDNEEKTKEQERLQQRQALRFARLSDETNYDAFIYLENWKKEKLKRRAERDVRITKFQEEARQELAAERVLKIEMLSGNI